MTPPEMLPVEQVDREAAAELMQAHEYHYRSGRYDQTRTVQAFARHRLTAAPAVVSAREALAQAAERAGCKEVPPAIRAGEVVFLNSEIALDALAHLPSPAPVRELREAAQYVVDVSPHWSGRGMTFNESAAIKGLRAALALTESATSAGEAR